MTERRQDLGALLHQLARTVIDREVPVLRGHDLEMWDYVVLGRLEHGPAPTQSQLAIATRRDKTRLIPILDRLEARDLLRRTADPDDRRNRIVTLTSAGRSLLADCRASIRALEDDLLAELAPGARTTFLMTLERLSTSIGIRTA
jgi:DNA-binding MarR family transcriptional regulator